MRAATLSTANNRPISSPIPHHIKLCAELENIGQKSNILKEGSLKWQRSTFAGESEGSEGSSGELGGREKDDSESEVSLEEDLLFEHKAALEEVLNGSAFSGKSSRGDIFKDATLEQFLQARLGRLRAVQPALVQRFLSFLCAHKPFLRMLQHLYYSYPTSTASPAFSLLFFAWELYYPCLTRHLSLSQTQATAARIADRVACGQQSRGGFKGDQEEWRRVVTVVAASVVLVMENSFSNPHYIPANKNRELVGIDPETQECEAASRKRAKLE